MAGEWIPVDVGIWSKPEVAELVDLTGTCEDSVVARLIRVWGWASLHTADGVIRATPERLARMHGGDAAFWKAVETVGWLSFDSEAGTMTVHEWEKRFSKAAKAREADRIRKSIERQRDSAACPGPVRDSSDDERTDTGPEKRTVPPPPPPQARGEQAAAIRKAWTAATEAGFVQPHLARNLPPGIWDRLAEPGWFEDAFVAIERLRGCRYFKTPATLRQLVLPDFVTKVLDGTYDGPKNVTPQAAPDGRPSAEAAARRFEQRSPATQAIVNEYRAKKGRKAPA